VNDVAIRMHKIKAFKKDLEIALNKRHHGLSGAILAHEAPPEQPEGLPHCFKNQGEVCRARAAIQAEALDGRSEDSTPSVL
jgi:hypothetical protein